MQSLGRDRMGTSQSWRGKYIFISELGHGGNGEVIQVKRKSDGRKFALKQLYDKYLSGNYSSERKHRFTTEIRIVSKYCMQIKGIIPIVDRPKEGYWYVMPIATESTKHICDNDLSIREIIKGMVDLSETLINLHARNISHRDIKPANIYYYKDRFCFSDFGLVYNPEDEDHFTRSDKGLGAIFTIAPEMKRDPKNADGKKADVFSMAKTMWMFLTGDEKGFDGVYDYRDKTHSLRFIEKYKNIHIVELEDLLKRSTDNDPNNRPTMTEFRKSLLEWTDIYSDYDKSQLSEWRFIKTNAFNNIPESASWRSNSAITDVLNVIGASQAYNHMMFSGEGGLDFQYACAASETGFIEIHAGGYCHIVKPKVLYFESFDQHWWNYFLLELDEVDPILALGITEYEPLVEDAPGHYVSAEFEPYKVYDYNSGKPLPEDYRMVYRYLRGKMLFVVKNGPYNAINGTYDGRHGLCSHDEFRKYTQKLIENFQVVKNKAIDAGKFNGLTDLDAEIRIAESGVFDKNPFCKPKSITPSVVKVKQPKESKEIMFGCYASISFNDYIDNISLCESNIKFYLEFVFGTDSFERLFHDNIKCICTDGYIHEIDTDSPNDYECCYLYNREEAIEFKNKCEKRFYDICKSNVPDNTEFLGEIFVIHICKMCTPSHLFSKEEIESVMRHADDRIDNQLVIDENGYPQIISRDKDGSIYPVRYETWDARNNYVGKYSTLSTLDETYLGMLQGWLRYLQVGESQYIDYTENEIEEELLEKIRAYY